MSQPPPGPPPASPPPPSAPPPGGERAPSGPRADFFPRLGGAFIDGILLAVVHQIVVLITNFYVGILFAVVVGIVYATYFIGSGSGQTVGMKLLNIRAIDAETGGRVDYGKAVVRYLVAIVSGWACFIGYLWMLWDPEKQTWHDKVAGTFVVPTAASPVTKWPG